MATKTFSGRIEEQRLAYADALAQESYGVSFGQYCSSVLLDVIEDAGELPHAGVRKRSQKKERALSVMKGFSSAKGNAKIGAMSDSQIKDLIASRYE